MAGRFYGADGRLPVWHGVGGFTTKFIHQFIQTPHLAPCPLASQPCTQRKPPAAARARSAARKKRALKRRDSGNVAVVIATQKGEGGGACTRRTKRRTTPVRRRAPVALRRHDPATPNVHGVTPPSHRKSLVLWRLVLVRDMTFVGAAFFFVRPSTDARLCVACRGGRRALRKAARSADLA